MDSHNNVKPLSLVSKSRSIGNMSCLVGKTAIQPGLAIIMVQKLACYQKGRYHSHGIDLLE